MNRHPRIIHINRTSIGTLYCELRTRCMLSSHPVQLPRCQNYPLELSHPTNETKEKVQSNKGTAFCLILHNVYANASCPLMRVGSPNNCRVFPDFLWPFSRSHTTILLTLSPTFEKKEHAPSNRSSFVRPTNPRHLPTLCARFAVAPCRSDVGPLVCLPLAA